MEKYPKNSLYADCPSRVYGYGGSLRGLACYQILRRRPLTSLEVLWRFANARHACSGCAPLTDGAAAGTWRGETDAWGLHGGDLAVGLARMLLQSVPMG